MDNDRLAELDPLCRLLFIYLWMLADKAGRLEDRPKRIAAQALPYDRDADVNQMLDDLAASGFIARYQVDGTGIIQVLAFNKHQTPHVRESESQLPGPDQSTAKEVTKHNLGSAEASPRSPDSGFSDSLIPDSLIPDSSASADRVRPTPGEACKAMRQTGMPDVSPSHPTLIALLDGGMTVTELVSAAADAVAKKKGFAYALKVAEGRRRDAAAIGQLPQARGSPTETAYQRSMREKMTQWAPGIAAKPPDFSSPFIDLEPPNVTAIESR